MDEDERRKQEEEEDKQKERELIAEKEKQEALEKEYQERIEDEERNLNSIRKIQEEMAQLNKSLASCINIAAASIANVTVRKKCDYLRTDNQNAFQRANQTVDIAIEDSKQNISQLQSEKDEVYKERKAASEQLEEHREQMREKQAIQRLAEA